MSEKKELTPGKFISTKVYDGFSCVFRQWKAENTHCRFLHGYGVSFKLWFHGELDERNWVFDFGGLKRAKELIDGKNPKEWLDFVLLKGYVAVNGASLTVAKREENSFSV